MFWYRSPFVTFLISYLGFCNYFYMLCPIYFWSVFRYGVIFAVSAMRLILHCISKLLINGI